MFPSLPLSATTILIRSLQKEVDLPAFEPDTTRDSNKSSLGLDPDALPTLHERELWFESRVVSGSNAGKSTSFWRERISRGNVAFIDPLGHLWLCVGVFPSLPLSATPPTPSNLEYDPGYYRTFNPTLIEDNTTYQSTVGNIFFYFLVHTALYLDDQISPDHMAIFESVLIYDCASWVAAQLAR